ncbi:hypothetical protein [Pantoea phage LIMEzero]|uniref:Uncharacterized protein n=1 Tax=Pantoea phage LIMEzero TaxID=943335 RepID=F4N9W0_9CAUD|nr:hypothetical protein LIMEzero_ORF57 [Pantoea phage LIMEzero]CBY88588.1 hypothetical protein [Pantoea phage LIMEzero]
MSLLNNGEGRLGRQAAGFSAQTTQSFIEAHVKNGVLYQMAWHPADVAAGANSDLVFTVPANTIVLIKSRVIQTDAAFMTADVYDTPTYTGGTILPSYNLNLNSSNVSASVLRGGPTVTATGTKVAASSYLLGSSTQGSSQRVAFSTVPGFERFLMPDKTYLLRINNGSSFDARLVVDLVWFEGLPSRYPVI